MQKYITLEQERLAKVFTTMPIPFEWFFALNNGQTIFYNDDKAILNYYFNTDSKTMFINSIAQQDSKFPKSMLRDIQNLIISHNKVIIASSVQEIAKHMLLTYGFEYDKDKQIYTKGL